MTVPRNPSLADALSFVVGLTILRFVTVAGLYSVDEDAAMGTSPWHWVILGAHAIVVVVIVALAMRVAKSSMTELGWSAFVPARDVPWALAALAGAAVFPIGVTLYEGGAQAVIDGALVGPLATRMAFLAVGALAAFTEESVFRGLLQPALVRKLGAPAGIGLTCVIFSLYHLPRHPFAFVGRMLTGLAYGVAAHRTKALWAGAIGHFLTWALLGAL